MLRRMLLSVVIVVTMSVPAAAEWGEEANMLELPAAKAATANCSGGVVYDDGVLNHAYSLGDGDPGDSTMVMRLDLPPGTTSLDQVCLCFARAPGDPSSMSFDLVVYNDNGAGGQPGSLVAAIPATASGIPTTIGTFFSYNTAGLFTLPDNTVYVGARWPGGGRYLCGDASTSTVQRNNYGSFNQGSSWSNLTTLFGTPPNTPPRALGIRADPHTAVGGCIPSTTAMCLNNNRFKVEATFATASSPTGTASTVELTDDSGYLWFFNSANIELVVKVLNACGVNNRYWVFAAGLTNVQVELKVTDTQTGHVRTYFNPLNQPYPPLQDTSAFATCP